MQERDEEEKEVVEDYCVSLGESERYNVKYIEREALLILNHFISNTKRSRKNPPVVRVLTPSDHVILQRWGLK